jgi:hypothetical protein
MSATFPTVRDCCDPTLQLRALRTTPFAPIKNRLLYHMTLSAHPSPIILTKVRVCFIKWMAIFAMGFNHVLGGNAVAVLNGVYSLSDQPKVERVDAPFVAASVVNHQCFPVGQIATKRHPRHSVSTNFRGSIAQHSVSQIVNLACPSPTSVFQPAHPLRKGIQQRCFWASLPCAFKTPAWRLFRDATSDLPSVSAGLTHRFPNCHYASVTRQNVC